MSPPRTHRHRGRPSTVQCRLRRARSTATVPRPLILAWRRVVIRASGYGITPGRSPPPASRRPRWMSRVIVRPACARCDGGRWERFARPTARQPRRRPGACPQGTVRPAARATRSPRRPTRQELSFRSRASRAEPPVPPHATADGVAPRRAPTARSRKRCGGIGSGSTPGPATPSRRYRPAEVRPPTPDQVAALLAAVGRDDPAFATFLCLAATTGARRSQMLALHWSDVDFDRAALALTRARVEGPHGPGLAPTKTGPTYRVEPDRARADSLTAHRGTVELDDCSFVFNHADGGPFLPNHVTKRSSPLERRPSSPTSGCTTPGTSWHADAQRRRADSDRLTAAQPRPGIETLNVYAYAVPGGDRVAAETIAALLVARAQ